jgi:hypothetical protein
LKKKLCEENGVKLIEIPYEYDFKDEKKLEDFIRRKLVEFKVL